MAHKNEEHTGVILRQRSGTASMAVGKWQAQRPIRPTIDINPGSASVTQARRSGAGVDRLGLVVPPYW